MTNVLKLLALSAFFATSALAFNVATATGEFGAAVADEKKASKTKSSKGGKGHKCGGRDHAKTS